MRTYSTPESAVKGEITKLAIIECILSVAIYVAIAVHFRTLRHLYVAIGVAPFMLFRTDKAAKWGLRTAANLTYPVEFGFEMLPNISPSRILFYVTGFMFVGFITVYYLLMTNLMRLAITAYGLVRTPVVTIREIPRNWVRQALCTDFAHPPELLPLQMLYGTADDLPTFRSITTSEMKQWSVPLFLAPVFYRVSFKATAIVYLPLIWVAQTTIGGALSLKQRIERITKGELEKARRALAWLVLTLVAVKLVLTLGVIDPTVVTSKFSTEAAVLNLISNGGGGRFSMMRSMLARRVQRVA